MLGQFTVVGQFATEGRLLLAVLLFLLTGYPGVALVTQWIAALSVRRAAPMFLPMVSVFFA